MESLNIYALRWRRMYTYCFSFYTECRDMDFHCGVSVCTPIASVFLQNGAIWSSIAATAYVHLLPLCLYRMQRHGAPLRRRRMYTYCLCVYTECSDMGFQCGYGVCTPFTSVFIQNALIWSSIAAAAYVYLLPLCLYRMQRYGVPMRRRRMFTYNLCFYQGLTLTLLTFMVL